MTTTNPSPFTCLEDAFAALSCEPRPLAFDGRDVPGLPDRAIPLTELRGRLLHPSTSYATRNAVIAILVTRAQDEAGAATIALAGMLLPGLRRAAHPLVRSCPERAADIEADMLAGLLFAIAGVSPRRRRLAGYLVGTAFSAAKGGVRKELAERGRISHTPIPAAPHRPFGHPDFVLYEAALDGAISADDAELIGSTRLEGVSLKHAAYVRGIKYKTASERRCRAEVALCTYLREGGVRTSAEVREARGAAADATQPPTARFVESFRPESRPSPATSTGAANPRRERRLDRRSE